MFSHRLRNLAGTALAASAFGLLTIMTGAGTASAGTVDVTLVDILADKGIAYAAGDAQLICAELDEGTSPDAIINQVLHDTDLSEDQAVYLVAASVVAYCPEYSA